MSGNIWAVLNNVDDAGSLKKKKPAQKGKQQQKPVAAQSQGASNKPQLQAKAARAFQDGQKAKQQKKPAPKVVPKPAAPAPAPAPASSSSSSSSKSSAKPQSPAIVVKSAATPVQAAAPAALPTSQKVVNYQKALNAVLNGQSALFQVSLMRSSEVGVLQGNPYRVVGDMVKSPQFLTNLGLSVKADAREFAKKDVRTKVLGRVNRVGLAHHLLALLCGYSPVEKAKTEEEATRLVTGLLEGLWNISAPAEQAKRVAVNEESAVADEEDEAVGSAGNVKRDAVTLFDFIAPAKTKGGKKGKAAPKAAAAPASDKGKEKVAEPAPVAAPVAAAAPAETAPAAQKAEGNKEDPTSWRTDVIDTAKQLSRRIPSSIQCVRVEPTFLYSLPEVKASGKQIPHYFQGEGCDHCYAFWEDGKGDIYFLLTTGGRTSA